MLYFRTHPLHYLQSSPGWYFQLFPSSQRQSHLSLHLWHVNWVTGRGCRFSALEVRKANSFLKVSSTITKRMSVRLKLIKIIHVSVLCNLSTISLTNVTCHLPMQSFSLGLNAKFCSVHYQMPFRTVAKNILFPIQNWPGDSNSFTTASSLDYCNSLVCWAWSQINWQTAA